MERTTRPKGDAFPGLAFVEPAEDRIIRIVALGTNKPAMRMKSVAPIRTDTSKPGAALARRVVPWFGSIFGHVLVIAIVVLLTWNLAQHRDQQTTPLVTASLSETTAAPIPRLDVTSDPLDSVELAPLEVESISNAVPAGALTLPGLRGSLPDGLGGSAPTPLGHVEFAGLGAGAARKIVFVVDASGSMIGVFPFVRAELARSLTKLSAAQSYSVIFFQKDEALLAPPRGRLAAATNEEVSRTLKWIRGDSNSVPNVVPSGRSNPMRALERALALRPEVIFLLSSNVTGSGRYEVDLDELLDELDKLNPRDPVTGNRTTSINCIQFLDPDPLDALREIVNEHGSPEGYRFLGRTELGL